MLTSTNAKLKLIHILTFLRFHFLVDVLNPVLTRWWPKGAVPQQFVKQTLTNEVLGSCSLAITASIISQY